MKTTAIGKIGEQYFKKELMNRQIPFEDVSIRGNKRGCDFIVNGLKVEVSTSRVDHLNRYSGNLRTSTRGLDTFDIYIFVNINDKLKLERIYIFPKGSLDGLSKISIYNNPEAKSAKKYKQFLDNWGILTCI